MIRLLKDINVVREREFFELEHDDQTIYYAAFFYFQPIHA
jgi:hypothetical protein